MRLHRNAWEERRPVIIIFALLLVLAVLGFSRSAQALTVYFDQTAYKSDVWLQVQDPFYAASTGNFQASYNNGQNSIDFSAGKSQTLMSKPVKLSEIGSGGLTIDYSNSAVFFIYYDDPSQESRTAAPAHMSSKLRFMPFELTMMGGSGDQGNLTAINYFTAPLGITSYQNDPAQNPSKTAVIQQTGFGNNSAATIGAQLFTASNGNSDAVIQDGDNNIIRFLGPSNFNGDNPWPSFIPYAKSVNKAGQHTTINRTNGFNFAAPDNTPVYQFGGNMDTTVAADGTITLAGSITVSTNASPTGTNPTLPTSGKWTDATITISASNATDYNNAIYGQAANSAVTFTGQAWTDFETFTKNTLRNSSLPHNTTSNQSLFDLGAFDTTKAMLIGEITTGLLGGFINSDYKVGGQAIKDMESNSWWSLSGNPAFSTIQPDNAYYNLFANVIFNASNNTVYGVPYSDRFGTGPLVNTVNYNGTPINYWTIDIGSPLALKPTPL